MTQEQQVGHQKVLFDTLLEAIEFRETCPICDSKLSLTCSTGAIRVYEKNPDRSILRAPEWSYKRSYCLAIRNISNTADYIRVWDDGKTTELFTEVAIKGQDGIFHFPLTMGCRSCSNYKHAFRIAFNLTNEPSFIVEVKLVSLTIKLGDEENMVVRSYFYPPRSELVINDKTYELDFVDINPFKSKELFERFSSIVPFI